MGMTRHWKPIALLAAALVMLLAGLLAAREAPGSKPPLKMEYPVISQYGGVVPRDDDNEDVPASDGTYKVIFDVDSGAESPSQLNPGLKRVGRAINVFAANGVAPERLHFVAIIHGAATRSVIADPTYRQWFDTKNPNTDLIAALRKAGVKVEVCGQALSHWRIGDQAINPDVAVAPAALTTLAIYGMRGYAYERL
ncbi:intracellular sulfur oxidation DsrE/DsrF family protein [Kushneria sinocarnis]|uniref:Intracellular sulfur oxidation DsrE/DsrF family protein n=1 Tax=Kushneria sinocarnis TaxID=595502 RepID=A0A420WTC7_9GAMM|nr:DsrE family protein [Kushneria sinocarnis]RKQ96346.1 intracellular sulfur oxidation DsrE/DsrF family protein [Kushneria sinocarnis]